jgi:hypothetical protein
LALSNNHSLTPIFIITNILFLAVMQASVQVMEQGLADGSYIDYWMEDDHFVCIRVTSIGEISDKVRKKSI